MALIDKLFPDRYSSPKPGQGYVPSKFVADTRTKLGLPAKPAPAMSAAPRMSVAPKPAAPPAAALKPAPVIRYPLPAAKAPAPAAAPAAPTEDVTRYGSPAASDQKGQFTAINQSFGFDENGKLFPLPPGFTGPSGDGLPAAPAASGTTPKPGADGGESLYDKAAKEYVMGLDRDVTDEDREAIREQTRREAQDRLDAINALYDSLVAEENIQGTDRLGSQRALAARRGLLSTDFGEAQKGQVKKYNADVVGGINARRAADVSAVLTGVANRSADLIKAKEDEARGNAQTYLDYLKGVESEAQGNVETLAKGGTSMEDLDADTLNQLLEETGYDQLTMKAIWNSNLPKELQREFHYEKVGDTVIAFSVNPKTGALEREEVTVKTPIDTGETIRVIGKTPYIEKKNTDGTIVLRPYPGFRAEGSGSGGATKKEIDDLQTEVDNLALDATAAVAALRMNEDESPEDFEARKSATFKQTVPEWAQRYLTPEIVKGSVPGTADATGRYVAKKVSEGDIAAVQTNIADAEKKAKLQLQDPAVVTKLIQAARQDVTIGWEDIRREFLAEGVPQEVYNKALRNVLAAG